MTHPGALVQSQDLIGFDPPLGQEPKYRGIYINKSKIGASNHKTPMNMFISIFSLPAIVDKVVIVVVIVLVLLVVIFLVVVELVLVAVVVTPEICFYG